MPLTIRKNQMSEDKISDLDDNILIVNEQMKVQIEGTVKYVSENCKISDGDGRNSEN